MSFAPQIRSQIITRGTTASTTAVINLPATVSAGDTLLVVFRCAVAGAVTFPGGGVWTELVDDSPDGSDDQVAIAWKKADGTEGGTTITLANGNGRFAACAWAIRDADDPSIRPPELNTVAIGTTGEPDAGTSTPTGGAKSYLFLTVYTMEGEQSGVTAYPSGYTLGQIWADSGTTAGVTTNCTMAGAGKRLSTPAASDDAGAWDVTGTLDDSASYTIAFHPVTLRENVRITDTVTAEIPSNLLEATISENLKVDDIGQGATQLVGQIKVQDIISASLNPLETAPTESIKVTDTPNQTLDPLETSRSESIRVTDSLQTTLDPLETSLTESIKVFDDRPPGATLSGDAGDLTASLTENLKVDDIGQGQTQLVGAIRVTDGPVVATMDVPGDLSASLTEHVKVSDANDSWAELSKDEYIRVSDVVTVTLNPLETSQQETIKVSDSAQASLGELAASLSENIKVTDSISTLLNPEQAVLSESVRVSDQVAAELTLLQIAMQESVTVTDGPAVGSFGLAISIGESVRVTDSLSVLLDLGPVSLIESIKVSDSVQATLIDQGQLSTSLQEAVKVSDSAQTTLDPLETSLTEGLKVTDTVFTILGAGAFIEEPIKVRDTVSAALSHLETSLSESVRVTDTIELHPATSDYIITVRPRTTHIRVTPRATILKITP